MVEKGWLQHPKHECACHLASIDNKLTTLLGEVSKLMGLNADVLARVKAAGTTLESIKLLVEGFVRSGDMSPEAAAEFNAALDVNAATASQIEAALQPAPPVEPPTG